MENAKLIEILNLAVYAWNAFCEFCSKSSDNDMTETGFYYDNLANEAHAKYRAYLNVYEIITGKTLCGIESVKFEISELSK